MMFRLPFLEDGTPPPFYQSQLSDEQRRRYDAWFIGEVSQDYYLRRFADFDREGRLRARWHWAAFFATSFWLLYRKRYLDCVVYCVAGWSFIKVNIAIVLALFEFMVVDYLAHDWQMPMRVAAGLSVYLFWSVLIARWADAYYYRMARREIADAIAARHDDERCRATLQKEGGVGFAGLFVMAALLGVVASTLLAQFVPIISRQQTENLVFDSYRAAMSVRQSHFVDMQSIVRCEPQTIDSQNAKLLIQIDKSASPHAHCAISVTITSAIYPVHYLKGAAMVMYHEQGETDVSKWRCKSSLNKQRQWGRCIGA